MNFDNYIKFPGAEGPSKKAEPEVQAIARLQVALQVTVGVIVRGQDAAAYIPHVLAGTWRCLDVQC